MGRHVGGHVGGLRGVLLGCVGGLCYAQNNVKKSQFYVILRRVLWGSLEGVAGLRDMNNA